MREKLIELIKKPIAIMPGRIGTPDITLAMPYAEELADHLIANGVIVDDGSLPEIVGKKNFRFANGKWHFSIRMKWKGKDWYLTHKIPADDLCSTCFIKKMATDNNVGDKWIPVTERLPENRDDVLVCRTWWDETRNPHIGWYNDVAQEWQILDSDGYYPCRKVTHWMPLPKPPKGE